MDSQDAWRDNSVMERPWHAITHGATYLKTNSSVYRARFALRDWGLHNTCSFTIKSSLIKPPTSLSN